LWIRNERREILSQIELSYDDLKQKMITEFQKHDHGILATSDGGYVTARKVRLVYNGLTFFCFTDRRSRKYQQMKANPNVAITADNIQIEGAATLKGHPLDEENAVFLRAYKKMRPEAYERSSRRHFPNRPEGRVVEITPKRVMLWSLTESDVARNVQASVQSEEAMRKDLAKENYMEILDVAKGEAHRVMVSSLTQAPAYRG
jgi:nitroimidazol reductase NimA-like FMN-containing flavoprotein (pyridoxamine 5'-phosphate oxidase superfamily)